MRRLLLLCFLVLPSFCGAQLSIDLTGGAGIMQRDVPEGFIGRNGVGCLSLNTSYSFKNRPIRINFASYLITKTRYEQFASLHFIQAVYRNNIVVMSGIGIETNSGKFLQLITSLQIGYWHSKYDGTLYDLYGNENDIDLNLHQIAAGPKITLALGKRNFKGVIQYESYLLSLHSSSHRGGDRFGVLSFGGCYSFKQKAND